MNPPALFTLIDVHSLHDGAGTVHRPGRLVLAGDRILAAGHPLDDSVVRAEAALPPDVTRVTYRGATAIPGLVDTHVHLVLGTGLRTYEQVMAEDRDELMLLRAAENARTHLRSGVTTVRDLGARGRLTFHLREAATQGIVTRMPSMVLCGRPITAPRGHFWFCGEEAEGPSAVRESVRRLASEGADVIKVMATGGGTAGTDRSLAYFSEQELAAAVDEAHARALRVVVHAQGTPGIRNAVAAGVDAIEHCDFLGPDGRPSLDEHLASEIAARGIFVDPTLHVLRISVDLLTELSSTRPLTADERQRLDSFKVRYEAGMASVRRFRELGIHLVGGTDAIRRFGDYHLTYETFRDCGLSTEDALATMTSVAADAMGIDDVAGRLAPGLYADVVILDSDPAVDDLALRRVRQVYRRGVAVL